MNRDADGAEEGSVTQWRLRFVAEVSSRSPPPPAPKCGIALDNFRLSLYHIIAIRLRYDYDEKLACSFLASNHVEWKQARAIRRSWIVVVS